MFIISNGAGPVDESSKQKYFSFRTDHDIGLVSLPVDGNPYSSRAVSAHILGVKDVIKDPWDTYLFSCGSNDQWVHMWEIKTQTLSLNASDDGIQPFLDLIPGSDPQWIKEEIMNVVFAMQLQRTEHDYPAQIMLKHEILVEELHYIMAALGYYPSQYEFKLLMEDAKFTLSLSGAEKSNTIELDQIIKLFINHRPVKPVEVDDLALAFKTVYSLKDEDALLPRSLFLKVIEEAGEPIFPDELLTLVSILCDRSAPSTDIDDLYVNYCDDDPYYEGDDDDKTEETSFPQREDQPDDWGGLNDPEYIPEDEDGDEHDHRDEIEEEEKHREIKPPEILKPKRDLQDFLPERLTKYTLICDLLNFKCPSKNEDENI